MLEHSVNESSCSDARRMWWERLFDAVQRYQWQLLVLAVGIQLAVLVSMIAQRATPLVTGTTVLLRVVPVDPRDLFRGDYVILSYDFSNVPASTIEGLPPPRYDSTVRSGERVYVSLVLEPDGRHWCTETISTTRPSGGVYLCGTVSDYRRIECGIESFYVQEGTGLEYEQAIVNHRLSAEVAVTSQGQATLRRLLIE